MRQNHKPEWLGAAQRTAAAVLMLLATAASARAVFVLKKGSPQPIVGYLVKQDDRAVVVREELPGAPARQTTIPRDQIDELIVTVDPARLAALDPAQLKAYREYAEELAEKRRDPEARDAARRLYAIVAARASGPLRRGALLGLLTLARSPAEERRLRAAAFLFAEPHDAALLSQTKMPAVNVVSAPGELLAAVRLIRQGRGAQARPLLDLPSVRRGAAALGEVATIDDLMAAAAARAPTDVQLGQLLRAELHLLGAAAWSAESARPAAWSRTIQAGQLAPLPSLELESLTEFDPAECLFRDGRWTRP